MGELIRFRTSTTMWRWLGTGARLGGCTLWAVTMLGACVHPQPATQQQLRTRAAFDLSCPAQQLRLYPLDERTTGVVGCGRRLAYVESCESARREPLCTWILDAPSAPAPYIQHAHQPRFYYGAATRPGAAPSADRRPAQPEASERRAASSPPPASAEPAAPAASSAAPAESSVPFESEAPTVIRDFGF